MTFLFTPLMTRSKSVAFAMCLVVLSSTPNVARGQGPRALMPIEYQNSAEFGWLKKPVLASRVLDDMTQPATWRSPEPDA